MGLEVFIPRVGEGVGGFWRLKTGRRWRRARRMSKELGNDLFSNGDSEVISFVRRRTFVLCGAVSARI